MTFVALLNLVFVVAVGLHHLSGDWPSSVQAGSTVALVILTLWYVEATHKLARAPERAQHREAATELYADLTEPRELMENVVTEFPIRPSDTPPSFEFADAETTDAFEAFTRSLRVFAVRLPPPLSRLVSVCAETLLDCSNVLEALALASKVEENLSPIEDQKGRTWSGLEHYYKLIHGKNQRPSWTEMLDGAFAREAQEALEDLALGLELFIQGEL